MTFLRKFKKQPHVVNKTNTQYPSYPQQQGGQVPPQQGYPQQNSRILESEWKLVGDASIDMESRVLKLTENKKSQGGAAIFQTVFNWRIVEVGTFLEF
jgi:hypothetical protein